MQVNKKKTATILLAGLSLGILSGCATVVSGTSQSLTVETIPAGATCVLTRDGERIGAIHPTPGTLQIGKDKDNIDISCTKEGYWETSGNLSADFQGMTFGNIIIGGLIGVVIDGASGAMHEYPSSFRMTMVPTQFASAAEREVFFAKWREDVELEAQAAIEKAEKFCEGSDCDYKRKQIGELKQKKLEEIAQKEQASKAG